MTRPRMGSERRGLVSLAMTILAAYTVFRIIQTSLLSTVDAGVPSMGLRIFFSVFDGAMLGAILPVAIWTSRRFPIGRRHIWHLAIHCVVAVAVAVAALLLIDMLGYAIATVEPPAIVEHLFRFTPIYVFAYAVMAAVAHTLRYQRALQEEALQLSRAQAQLTAAKLQAVSAQLQPHFLFNTLNGISALIHSDPDAADAMVIGLAKLLRRSLDVSEMMLVPLAEELDHLRCYLDIQRIRLGDRLRVRFDVEASVEHAGVPPLVLQPIAENAILHGMEGCTPLTIVVHASAHENILHLSLRNDGTGLVPGWKEGTGLLTVRSRIEQHFGDEGSLEVASGARGGTTVSIALPLRRLTEAPAIWFRPSGARIARERGGIAEAVVRRGAG